MKRSTSTMLVGFILAQCSIASAQNSWTWQNPLPQGNTLIDLSIIDSNTIIAIGYAGTIIKTTDAGAHWGIMNSASSQRLYGVDFANSMTGYAVGAWGTLLKSTDGGENWKLLPVAEGKGL